MTKHTPGPWRVGDASHTVFGPPNGNPSPATVATLSKAVEWRANAQLIAAAPELLAALRSLSVWLIAPDTSAATLKHWCGVISAAIAKAEWLERD